MLIIGCDFHTRYQQIAMMDQATGPIHWVRFFRTLAKVKGFDSSEISYGAVILG